MRTAEHQLRTIRVACAANLLLVLLLLTRPAALQAQFTFTTNNGAITITKYTGPGGAVTIPSTINGLPVTSIGNNAFRSKTGLTSVTIPDSVIRIGVEAFRSCPSLTNIAIGMNVASIESGAFEECASLTKVTIPSSVTNIGPYHVFNGCNGLTNITVAALNSVYGSLDGILFDKSQTTLITYPAGLTGRHYTIPHNVVSIGFDAFLGCLNLTSVTIPDGLIRIGEEAFRSCRSLTNIAIGTNVASIESSAFEECAGLTKVTIPNSVTNIGPYPVFLGCGNLTNITVDSLNFDYCSMDGVLFNKSKTTLLTYPPGMSESHYTIPDSVVSIGQSAFLSPVKLTSVTIPNGVTYLDQFAFYACLNLTNVTMGSGVTNIGPDAFYLCWSLTNIALPDSVTSIGDGAFYYCSSLASIVIPASVTSIGVAAFCYTYSLAGLYFKGGAPSLAGQSVFCGNNIVTVYYLPGATGWGPTFGGRPTAIWKPLVQTGDGSFGVRTNQFGFNIAWASGQVVVVEACTNLANPIWSPLQTNTLSGDSLYFSDPQWTNYPARFYRVRSP